ncbi:hypothetical protein NMG60_11019578 [Bertholletia excelsa]
MSCAQASQALNLKLVQEQAKATRRAYVLDMIRAVIVMNDQGKPRLVKFYDYQAVEKQQELIRRIYGVLCGRAENMSNFIQADSIFGPDARVVYNRYATLYFVIVFDRSENELAMLDLIEVFAETLDNCFNNVCRLDMTFSFYKVHTILDEIVLGGQVLETNSYNVVMAVEESSKLEKASNATLLIPKFYPVWQAR